MPSGKCRQSHPPGYLSQRKPHPPCLGEHDKLSVKDFVILLMRTVFNNLQSAHSKREGHKVQTVQPELKILWDGITSNSGPDRIRRKTGDNSWKIKSLVMTNSKRILQRGPALMDRDAGDKSCSLLPMQTVQKFSIRKSSLTD
ncbi:hypothetical protein EVAR_799_1 [Eumeta japonica]|uniref:Uncharacterized protein n=1 Tax=Eumeta variegata TaxID=151549 RepID=A0A4C1SCE5_EUMVA|nr:hypothetical protein EVAR_799_1 [Eumeta japonica]